MRSIRQDVDCARNTGSYTKRTHTVERLRSCAYTHLNDSVLMFSFVCVHIGTVNACYSLTGTRDNRNVNETASFWFVHVYTVTITHPPTNQTNLQLLTEVHPQCLPALFDEDALPVSHHGSEHVYEWMWINRPLKISRPRRLAEGAVIRARLCSCE